MKMSSTRCRRFNPQILYLGPVALKPLAAVVVNPVRVNDDLVAGGSVFIRHVVAGPVFEGEKKRNRAHHFAYPRPKDDDAQQMKMTIRLQRLNTLTPLQMLKMALPIALIISCFVRGPVNLFAFVPSFVRLPSSRSVTGAVSSSAVSNM